MDIKFENLAKIDEILNLLQQQKNNAIEKRWLNTSETAIYLGYSKEHIPKLKNSYFIDGVHYHKKAGRVLFDKYELDNWVTASQHSINPKEIAKEILKDLI